MQLTNIHLASFRTYLKEVIEFSPTTTLLVGPNAIGKTNIIEAITLLSLGKSFRAKRDSDVIMWNKELSRIQATCYEKNDTEQTKLEIVFTTGMVHGQKSPRKKYLVNNVSRRQIDFIGHLRSVLFSPSDLDLVTDSPSIRRTYLDTVLVQVDREYRRNLLSYERGLRQRNSLLDRINEGSASRSQLLFWNQLLIKHGSYLTSARKYFIDTINKYKIDNFSYQIVYDPSIISPMRLEEYKDQEVAAKSTLVGPQRDDFHFELIEKDHASIDVSRFGSRGEQRLAVLWLKLAELTYIQSVIGERPILLLDDIFSELDGTSRNIILHLMTQQQTIITSADLDTTTLIKGITKSSVIRLPFAHAVQ